jgi:hypothetical protein
VKSGSDSNREGARRCDKYLRSRQPFTKPFLGFLLDRAS